VDLPTRLTGCCRTRLLISLTKSPPSYLLAPRCLVWADAPSIESGASPNHWFLLTSSLSLNKSGEAGPESFPQICLFWIIHVFSVGWFKRGSIAIPVGRDRAWGPSGPSPLSGLPACLGSPLGSRGGPNPDFIALSDTDFFLLNHPTWNLWMVQKKEIKGESGISFTVSDPWGFRRSAHLTWGLLL